MYHHQNMCNDPSLNADTKRRLGCPVREHQYSQIRTIKPRKPGKHHHHHHHVNPNNRPKPDNGNGDLLPPTITNRRRLINPPLSRRMLIEAEGMDNPFKSKIKPLEMEDLGGDEAYGIEMTPLSRPPLSRPPQFEMQSDYLDLGHEIEPFGQSSSYNPRPDTFNEMKLRNRMGNNPKPIEPTKLEPENPYDFGTAPMPKGLDNPGDIQMADMSPDEISEVTNSVVGRLSGSTLRQGLNGTEGTLEDVPLGETGDAGAVDIAKMMDAGFMTGEGAEITGGIAAGIGSSLAGTAGFVADMAGPVGMLVGVGLLIKGITKKQGHDTTTPGVHRLEGHMAHHDERNEMYKNLKNQNTSGKYDDAISALKNPGKVYVVTSNKFHKLTPDEITKMKVAYTALPDQQVQGSTVPVSGHWKGNQGDTLQEILKNGGFYPTSIVHELDATGLAKAKAALQLNSNAYKNIDPSVLSALGLSDSLSKGWNGTSNIYRDDDDFAKNVTDDMVNQARGMAQQVMTATQAQATWSKNKATLDGMQKGGEEYNYYKSLMNRFAWTNFLDPITGKTTGVRNQKHQGTKPPILPPPKESFDDISKKVQNNQELSRAEQDYLTGIGYNKQTSITQFTDSITYKHNLEMINKTTDPTKRKYYQQQLRQYAYDHGLDSNGVSLNKGQRQAGTRPSDIPEDMQKQYDNDMKKYNQDSVNYAKYKELRNVMYRRQTLQHQADHLLDTGQNYNDVQTQIDALNQQIHNKYDDINNNDNGQGPVK